MISTTAVTPDSGTDTIRDVVQGQTNTALNSESSNRLSSEEIIRQIEN
jgi:hypothetical protein